ncbi:MAG: hypothetical protein ACRDLV_10620, partial [Solirubrobacteraceae bacterium]
MVTEVLLAAALINNTRMMLWPTAIQLTDYLHHVLGLYLRVAYNRENWQQRSEEFLDSDHRSIHLFDAYAMANLRLCSAVVLG